MFRGDKHKTSWLEGCSLTFMTDWLMTSDAQDVLVPTLQQDVAHLVGEPLVAGARQIRKVEATFVKMHITSGTYDFLIKIKNKHSKEQMLLMQNNENTVLVHETERKTVFSMPRSFEVIESFGLLSENAEYAVMNYIPLTEEERPLFEYRFKNSHALLKSQPGFIALRILRPIKANLYVIFMLWQNEKVFKDWQASTAYQTFYKDTNTGSKSLHLFSGGSYTKYYFISKEEEM